MQVRCIGNKGNNLSKKTLVSGYQINTNFSELSIESVYVIYGISFYDDSTLSYLITSKNQWQPFWYPAELFTVSDNLLPLEWYYNFLGYNSCISAIWGYKELALDLNHYDGIIEREKKDIEIFLKRKKEIDEFAELARYKGK